MLVREDPDGSLGADWGMYVAVAVADDEGDSQDQDHTADAHTDKAAVATGDIAVAMVAAFGVVGLRAVRYQ
jgi:hypothetical protein